MENVVRLSPLNAVVFACIFQDKEKTGPAMLEFLNVVLKNVNEEPISTFAPNYLALVSDEIRAYG